MKYKNIEQFVYQQNKDKIIFTAGPASLLKENILNLNPCFGRGDKEYILKEKYVLNKILKLCGQKKLLGCRVLEV